MTETFPSTPPCCYHRGRPAPGQSRALSRDRLAAARTCESRLRPSQGLPSTLNPRRLQWQFRPILLGLAPKGRRFKKEVGGGGVISGKFGEVRGVQVHVMCPCARNRPSCATCSLAASCAFFFACLQQRLRLHAGAFKSWTLRHSYSFPLNQTAGRSHTTEPVS